MATAGHGSGDIDALVHLAQRGDVGAFGRLVNHYHATLTRFCRHVMRDPDAARDLAQETLLRAYESIGRLEEPSRFGAWLVGIAANLARWWWRRNARSPLSLDTLAATQTEGWPGAALLFSTAIVSPDEAVELAERTRRLQAAIDTLPPSLGRVLVLHYLDDLSYGEVSAALDVPVSTVKSRLFKSRLRLRRTLLAEFAPTGRSSWTRRTAVPPNRTTTSSMPPIRAAIDKEAVTDAAFAFVTARWPSHDAQETLLRTIGPVRWLIPAAVLEAMVLDGVTRREDVAALIEFGLGLDQWDDLGT